METQKEIGFLDLIRAFDRRQIQHLIIGRRAVVLYGGPVLTADHDLWIRPSDRRTALSLLAYDLGFELSHPPETKRPIVTGYSGMKKYDLFFYRRITNREGENIEFDRCYADSSLLEDEDLHIRFRVPSIEDLIRLKKIRQPNVKDEQDIEYLLKAKQFLRR